MSGSATGDRAEEPVPDGGGGRQVVLVVRVRQERQPAVLRRLASRAAASRPVEFKAEEARNDPVLRLQEQRQQAALRRDASESVGSPATRRRNAP